MLVGDRAPAGAGAGDARLEERQLLGRVRPGAGVDVVGAEDHAGELGVGVGVLDGQPAAGQHADTAVVRAASSPAAAAAHASGQDGGLQLAVRARTSGVVSRALAVT